jgi:hypothetical protein
MKTAVTIQAAVHIRQEWDARFDVDFDKFASCPGVIQQIPPLWYMMFLDKTLTFAFLS